MKRIVSIMMAFLAISVILGAQTKVMSHRGYYAHPGSFENTLTSLKGAQQLGVEGVELDVHLTTDDSLVILHGPKIAGNPYSDIQKLDYATVKSCVLPNGDRIPSCWKTGSWEMWWRITPMAAKPLNDFIVSRLKKSSLNSFFLKSLLDLPHTSM
jgi:glycerophosphoryl diester phosphodiesterase